MNGSHLDLGPCCMCSGPKAFNIIMLPRRAPIPGHGWGCILCELPADGASAVVCNACMELYDEKPDLLAYCCRGYPKTEGRIAIADLPEGAFDHDHTKHTE